MDNYTIKFDGSCSPKNPGGMGKFGFLLFKNGERIDFGHGEIFSGPEMSNNYAEHYAAAKGMSCFLTHHKEGESAFLNILGDSQLVVKQLAGVWKIKDGLYREAAEMSIAVLKQIRKRYVTVHINWIPREQNQECDSLSKL